MDFIIKRIISYLPKPLVKTLFKCIYSAADSDSIAFCFVLCLCKRLFLVVACSILIIYTVLVQLLDCLFGKWLLKYEVVPFETYKKTNSQEDPGVTEMRALLRGEDCFQHNLDQSQRRPSVPVNFNPYNELYLAIFYTRTMDLIINLVDSAKQQDGFFSQILNRLFTRFDEKVANYFSSHVVLNKRY